MLAPRLTGEELSEQPTPFGSACQREEQLAMPIRSMSDQDRTQ